MAWGSEGLDRLMRGGSINGQGPGCLLCQLCANEEGMAGRGQHGLRGSRPRVVPKGLGQAGGLFWGANACDFFTRKPRSGLGLTRCGASYGAEPFHPSPCRSSRTSMSGRSRPTAR